MITVLLVDDHELVRTGIRFVLEAEQDIDVVAEASSGEAAIERLRTGDLPDVVILDINMPGIGGIETLHRLIHSHPELRLIVLSVQGNDPYPSKLLQMGAMGYLTKGCPANELVQAVRTVAGGQRFLSADVAQKLALTLLPGKNKSPIEGLSQREVQVLLMVIEGCGIQEIAERLCVSPKTVGTYRHRLYEKLDVSNDVELTHVALRHGVCDPDLTAQ
ncbi:MAG: response regulator [Gammaproteobacteria bacterium]|nr:response regulator [Gammaproteobacteria bacterium]